MSVKEIKVSINELIEQVDDKTILEAYYDILKSLLKVQKSQIIGFSIDDEPITKGSLEKEDLLSKYSGIIEDSVDLKKIMEEQNFKGIDKKKMDMLAKKADIQESIDELLEMLD